MSNAEVTLQGPTDKEDYLPTVIYVVIDQKPLLKTTKQKCSESCRKFMYIINYKCFTNVMGNLLKQFGNKLKKNIEHFLREKNICLNG